MKNGAKPSSHTSFSRNAETSGRPGCPHSHHGRAFPFQPMGSGRKPDAGQAQEELGVPTRPRGPHGCEQGAERGSEHHPPAPSCSVQQPAAAPVSFLLSHGTSSARRQLGGRKLPGEPRPRSGAGAGAGSRGGGSPTGAGRPGDAGHGVATGQSRRWQRGSRRPHGTAVCQEHHRVNGKPSSARMTWIQGN